MFGKAFCINRRRRDNDFQIGTSWQDLFQVAQQDIDVQAAFMRLIDDDRVVLLQQTVRLRFCQQDPVRHQLDAGVWAGLVGEADLVADHVSDGGVQLFRNPVGGCAGGNTPWLGMADHAFHTSAQLQTDLWQLGGLARPGLATDNHHLVGCDGDSNLPAS